MTPSARPSHRRKARVREQTLFAWVSYNEEKGKEKVGGTDFLCVCVFVCYIALYNVYTRNTLPARG